VAWILSVERVSCVLITIEQNDFDVDVTSDKCSDGVRRVRQYVNVGPSSSSG
jgi:hypothetical protein